MEKANQSVSSLYKIPSIFVIRKTVRMIQIKREVETVETHLSRLLSSSLTSISHLLSTFAETLFSSFAKLFAFSQSSQRFSVSLVSFEGVSSLGGVMVQDEVSTISDFDSLLHGAFSSPFSGVSSLAGNHSRQVSNVYSSQSFSNPAELSISTSETPVIEQEFTPILTETMDAPHSTVPIEEITESSPVPCVASEKRVHVIDVPFVGSPQELLSSSSFDVISSAWSHDFTLFLTSRGNVLSLLHDGAIPVGSGISQLPASMCDSVRLVPSLQMERALRHKRVVEIGTTGKASFALALSGELYVWGEGPDGELGLGDLKETSQAEVGFAEFCVSRSLYGYWQHRS